jgi:hypothetical protein
MRDQRKTEAAYKFINQSFGHSPLTKPRRKQSPPAMRFRYLKPYICKSRKVFQSLLAFKIHLASQPLSARLPSDGLILPRSSFKACMPAPQARCHHWDAEEGYIGA